MNKIIRYLIKLVIGLAILLLLFYKVGFDKIINTLKLTDPIYFFLAFITYVLSLMLGACNLFIMIRSINKSIKFRKFLKYFFMSRIASLFLPGRLGEFSILALLRNHDINVGQGSAAIITDKTITFASSAIFAIIGLTIFFGSSLTYKFMIILMILAVIGLILMSKGSRNFIKKFILRKYAYLLDRFSETIFDYIKKYKKFMFLNFTLTLIRILIIALSAWYMFLSLQTNINIGYIILISSINNIVTLIPITINGLGLKQSTGVYLYHLLGVGFEISAARYTLGIIINYGFGLLTLIFTKKIKD